MLIVVEGADGVGKSTQISAAADLISQKRAVKCYKFPDRSTEIGKIIDKALKKETILDINTLKHLFAANFYELAGDIRTSLEEGYIVICDRYIYSHYAYAIANNVSYCLLGDMPTPDLILYISSPTHRKNDMDDSELYESDIFQERVRRAYDCIFSNTNNVLYVTSDNMVDIIMLKI